MDQDIEKYIEMGRQQMYDKNYDEAERLFNTVSRMSKAKVRHMDILLNNCKEFRNAEQETKNSEKDIQSTAHIKLCNELWYKHEEEIKLDNFCRGGGSKEQNKEYQCHKIKNENKRPHEYQTSNIDYLIADTQFGKEYNTLEDKYALYLQKQIDHKKREQKSYDDICWDVEENDDLKERSKIMQNLKTETNIRQKNRSQFTEIREYTQYEGKANENLHLKEESQHVKNDEEEENLKILKKLRLNSSRNYEKDTKNEQLANSFTHEVSAPQIQSSGQNVKEKKQIRQCHVEPTENINIEFGSDKTIMEPDVRETEMLRMSLKLRAYVVQIGTKAFSSIPNYRPEVKFEYVSREIENLISWAHHSFINGCRQDCEMYLTQAEDMYSKVAIILPKASMSKPKKVKHSQIENNKAENTTVQINPTSYKDFVKGDNIDVTKCLQLAVSAIEAKNFTKAERLIKKSERICPTKNARELMKSLEAAKREVDELDARKVEEQAAKLLKVQPVKEDTTEVVVSAKEVFDVKDDSELKKDDIEKKKYSPIQTQRVIDKPAAEQCIKIAEAALKNSDCKKAEKILKKAKRLNPDIDIENLQSQIRAVVASRSSTDEYPLFTKDSDMVLQPTKNKKQNSKKCIKSAEYYLSRKDALKAEEFLMKAKEFYNFNFLEAMFGQLEKLKAEKNTENKKEIPEPIFVHSNSETRFAIDPSQEIPPAYHISNEQDEDTVEGLLLKGRLALKKGLLDEAEKYAAKCGQIHPGYAAGLLQNIDAVKKLRQGSDSNESILRSEYSSRGQCTVVTDRENETKENRFKIAKPSDKDKTIKKLQSIENTNLKPQSETILINVPGPSRQIHTNSFEGHNISSKGHYNNPKTDFIQNENDNIISTYHYTQKTDCENFEQAKKCVILAEQAYHEGDFDKSERLYTKALRMHPKDDIKECLKRVQKEKQSKLIEKENQKKAEMFLAWALDARESKNYYVAQKFLIKANRCNLNHNDVVETLLTTVQEEIKEKNKSKRKNKDEEEKEKEFKNEAVKYLKKAEEQLSEGDLLNAQTSAILSDSFSPSQECKLLLHRLFDKQCNDQRVHKTCSLLEEKQNMNSYKAERYMELAKNSIDEKDFKLAKQYLLLSHEMKPTVNTAQMIYNITDAIEQQDQKTSSSNSNDGGRVRKYIEKCMNYLQPWAKK